MAGSIRPINKKFHFVLSFSWVEYVGREHITLGEMFIGLLEHAYGNKSFTSMKLITIPTQVRSKDLDQIQLIDLDPKVSAAVLSYLQCIVIY